MEVEAKWWGGEGGCKRRSVRSTRDGDGGREEGDSAASGLISR